MASDTRMTRRGFLRNTAGLALGAGLAHMVTADQAPASLAGAPASAKEARTGGSAMAVTGPAWGGARRIDAHFHVHDADPAAGFSRSTGKLDRRRAEQSLQHAEKLGIGFLCTSFPLTSESPTPEEVRSANDLIFEAMKLSERYLGFCFLNPGYACESLEEIKRCIVDGGMVGIKLYHQYRICDPALTPVMGRAADLQVPVLMHAGRGMDTETRTQQPRLSDSAHMVRAAAMFPDTILIQAHIGGGGDWEWCLRHLESRPPNLYIDSSGSVVDSGIVDKTVAAVGLDHVLFATDMSMEEGVGKVLDADLTDEQRDRIFAGNLKDILARRRT